MSTVFRLDASIRGHESVTRAVADTLEAALSAGAPGTDVVRRDVAAKPLDPTVWSLTQTTPPATGTDPDSERARAMGVAAELADEMEAADAYIFSAPLYNFGVSQHVKTWTDILFGDPRFAPGQQPIAGHPAFLIVTRGGGYGPGTPRAGWDHGTGWLQRIFGDVLGLELTMVETELTLAKSTPGMEELHDLADTNLRSAHQSARSLGRGLAETLRVAA